MRPFIEDRNLNRYEFATLNRKQRVKFANKFSKIGEQDLEAVEDIFYELFLINNYNLSREEFDDILDFNDEKYGFTALYELITVIINEVFTQVGGNSSMKPPYLQMKQAQEETIVEFPQPLEEKPQAQQEEQPVPPINPIYY